MSKVTNIKSLHPCFRWLIKWQSCHNPQLSNVFESCGNEYTYWVMSSSVLTFSHPFPVLVPGSPALFLV